MNKAQLVEAIADKVGGRQQAADAVDAVLDAIVRAVVAGDRVSVTGFGSFEKVDRPARYARNPQTGERVRVKKTSVPRFRAGQGFKDLVAGSKKLPKNDVAVKKAPKGSLSGGTSTRSTVKKAAAKKATPPRRRPRRRPPRCRRPPRRRPRRPRRPPTKKADRQEDDGHGQEGRPGEEGRHRQEGRREEDRAGQEGRREEGPREEDHGAQDHRQEGDRSQEVVTSGKAQAPGRAPLGETRPAAVSGRRPAAGAQNVCSVTSVMRRLRPRPLAPSRCGPAARAAAAAARPRRRPGPRNPPGCRRRAAHCRCGLSESYVYAVACIPASLMPPYGGQGVPQRAGGRAHAQGQRGPQIRARVHVPAHRIHAVEQDFGGPRSGMRGP